jgi:hypothetical protein
MGGAASLPTNTDMPQVLNFILQEMFRRTDLADIYSLADPDRCKRYVIVATDALESLFVKMRIQPTRARDGTLYFQSIDGILKSMPPDIRAKQREYCVELAFFFIRIFQIFGALFLSMYDSRLPITDPSDDIHRDAVQKGVAFLNPKDFLGFSNPPQSSWFGTGGELTNTVSRDGRNYYIDPNNIYSILNYHLSRPSNKSDPLDFDGNLSLSLDQKSLYNTEGDTVSFKGGNPQPIIYYFFNRNSNNLTIQAVLNITGAGTGMYMVQLSNFSLVAHAQNSSKFSTITVSSETLIKNPGRSIPISTGDNYSKTKGQPLPIVLKAMFDKAIVAALGEPPFTVVKYLKKLRYISGDYDKNQNIAGTHVFLLKGQENEGNVKIAYSDKIKIQGQDQAKTVTITARMSIKKPERATDISTEISYRLTLDFGGSDITPPEYRGLLSIPTTYKYMTFTARSEDSAPSSETNDLSIPEYLERVFKEITASTYSDGIKGLKITRAGLVEPYDSPQINESLKVKKLWQAMAKDPPVKSHCIARAVQLLSLDAIKGNMNTQAYSSICRLSFAYQKDGSLPTPGKPVVEESGIYALSLLFFEGLVAGAPKIVDPAGYREYLRYLKYLFERYPSIDMIKTEPIVPGKVPGPDSVPVKIEDIYEKTPKMCEDRGDSRILIPKPLANNLRSITSALFSQQQSHFQQALTLIFSIFDQNSIQRDKKLKFNQRIIAGGMPEINKISHDTRSLLLKYYQGCELTYRNGLLTIYNYEKSTGKRLDSMTVGQISSGASFESRTTTYG